MPESVRVAVVQKRPLDLARHRYSISRLLYRPKNAKEKALASVLRDASYRVWPFKPCTSLVAQSGGAKLANECSEPAEATSGEEQG